EAAADVALADGGHGRLPETPTVSMLLDNGMQAFGRRRASADPPLQFCLQTSTLDGLDWRQKLTERQALLSPRVDGRRSSDASFRLKSWDRLLLIDDARRALPARAQRLLCDPSSRADRPVRGPAARSASEKPRSGPALGKRPRAPCGRALPPRGG